MTTTWPRARGSPVATPPALVESVRWRRCPGTATRAGWPAWTRSPVTCGGGCAPTTGRCGSSRWWSTARSRGRWPRRCTRTLPRPMTRPRTARRSRSSPGPEHATKRVGPRGAQVQVPVEGLEAVTVRHFTSRAGDPHRHLHLQILSRVCAAGKWRGLHTVGIRDFLSAINGIGHAAMACDPELNAAFAANGYTRGTTGELLQLAPYVGPMSARAAQIAANSSRYERKWTQAHPGEHPGPALRRAWEARAWADGRPDKVQPRPGEVLEDRWRAELSELGYRAPTEPVSLAPPALGALDRDGAMARVLVRLAAARSAWNGADVRGEVEQLLAAD